MLYIYTIARTVRIKHISLPSVLAVILLFSLAGAIGCGVPQEQFDDVTSQLTESRAVSQGLNADIESATEKLDESVERSDSLDQQLAQVRSAYAALEVELTSANSQVEGLHSESESLQTKLTTNISKNLELESSVDDLDAQLALTQNEQIDLKTELAEAIIENQGLVTSIVLADTENSNLSTKLIDSGANIQNLESNLQTSEIKLLELSGELQKFKDAGTDLEAIREQRELIVNDIASLQITADNLAQQIDDLEFRRQPLILDTYISRFACTGSMEPKITCLDSATWLANFNEQDIAIGTVISFSPVPECNVSSPRIAHRVVDIAYIGGEPVFLPKGDANQADDGCWLPAANINAYLLEVHEGTHPENQELRTTVNTAKEIYEIRTLMREQAESASDIALANYNTKSDQYDVSDAYYDQKYVEYCGSLVPGCSLASPQYEEINSLYGALVILGNELTAAYDTYSSLYNSYLAAHNHYIAAYDEYWAAVATAKS